MSLIIVPFGSVYIANVHDHFDLLIVSAARVTILPRSASRSRSPPPPPATPAAPAPRAVLSVEQVHLRVYLVLWRAVAVGLYDSEVEYALRREREVGADYSS